MAGENWLEVYQGEGEGCCEEDLRFMLVGLIMVGLVGRSFTCDVTRNEPKYIGAVALFSADMLSVEFEVVIGDGC